MKILHYIPVYAPAWQFGGPVQSTARLCEALAALGHEVTVYTTNTGLQADPGVSVGLCTVRNGVKVWYFSAAQTLGIRSRGMSAAVKHRVGEFDLVHITGVWQTTSVAACRAAERGRVPYVVSPRGALGTYSWTRGSLKKRLYYRLFEARNVARAAGIHYTSRQEMEECARLKLPGRSCIIPNALDLSRWRRNETEGRQWRQKVGLADDEFAFINVGRLHHKKGLDLLPEVLHALPHTNWRMVFVGLAEDKTKAELQAKFNRLGLAQRVLFFDLVAPEQLIGAYSGADLFLLPSRHENFGNVVIEAMACGCPVILSDQTGVWDQVNDLGLATVLPRNAASWVACLGERMADDRRRLPVWVQDSETVRDRFAYVKTATAMVAFYAEILASRVTSSQTISPQA